MALNKPAPKLNPLRSATIAGLTGALICFVAFAVNWWITKGPYPGYQPLTYPGILATRLFTEEIDFWPKLGIMIVGQGLVYFSVAWVVVRLAGRKSR